MRKVGVPMRHWAHHRSQAYEYEVLLLPPYQFTKHRHWLEVKQPVAPSSAAEAATTALDSYAGPPADVLV